MRRFLALGVALFALIAAGFLWTRDRPVAVAAEPVLPPVVAVASAPDAVLAAPVSRTGPVQREARRFGRYDKDRDAAITRDEYMATRRKNFARLDVNGDGRLGFEEYAVAARKKFGTADKDGDGVLKAAEFATTAVVRKAKAVCECGKGEE